MLLAKPLSVATPAQLGQGTPMSTTLTTRSTQAEDGGVEDANDLRASTGILISVGLSCALWAGIVVAIFAII